MTRTLFALALAGSLAAPAALAQVAMNPATRTIQSKNFYLAWNTGVDTEAVTTLEWMGSANLTGSNFLNTCADPGNAVEYSGNSQAPPDPESGGLYLVGGGTVTPPGTVAWSAQFLPTGGQVTINSKSTNCPPQSAGINVQTLYLFPHPESFNAFGVERSFDFTTTTFSHDFRPYIPRLGLTAGYTEVLYPTPKGSLATASVYNCPSGCTGPKSEPGAKLLSPAWDSAQGWFAIHNPTTLQGVVVRRIPSADPQGNPITAQLWIDYDAAGSLFGSNASSFLLISPTGGFTGGVVTELDTLCFYNSTIWTPSIMPPPECAKPQVKLSPWNLTFAGQTVGTSSAPQSATLTSASTQPLSLDIVATGDFAQSNDCPSSLPAAASCTITVTFTPTATGLRTGSVSVGGLVRLSLAGTGLASM